MKDSDYYTLKEVATKLGLSRPTVVRLATNGTIIGHKFGKQWRFPKKIYDDAIEQALADKQTKS